MSDRGTPLLEVADLHAGYDGRDVVRGVNLEVRSGEIVCVIGPNGSGKSTLFSAVYGFLRPRAGRVTYLGEDITGESPRQLLARGMTIVPQQRSLFPQMSVDENLQMGMYLERDRTRIERRKGFVLELFPELAARVKQQAGTMSGGEQRMLEIGRALMWEPRLVLLDEPSAGLAPRVSTLVIDTILRLNRELGLTVLMIEQNVRQGLRISDRGYVLEWGTVSHTASGRDLSNDPAVHRAFLGRIGEQLP
jgi:ABC-type branched-subunit amino acid transport system ATPase component